MIKRLATGKSAKEHGFYLITLLGDDSYPFVQPKAINNFGQVVGYTSGATPQAFLWQPDTKNETSGTLNTLPPLGAVGSASYATGINSKGEISGYAEDSNGIIRPVFWPTNPNGPFPLHPTQIDPEASPFVSGQFNPYGGINDRGEIATNVGPMTHAALYLPSASPTVQEMANNFYDALAINNSGEFVGSMETYKSTYQAACYIPSLIDPAHPDVSPYVNIADPDQGGLPFAISGDATDINDDCEIAANTLMPDPSNPTQLLSRTFLWKPKKTKWKIIDLQNDHLDLLLDPSGTTKFHHRSLGLNNYEQVVGTVGNALAFLYEGPLYGKPQVYSLNSLIDPKQINADNQWQLSSAWDINDQGQIVGLAVHNMDYTYWTGFLLTPLFLSR
jgi:probable HAF family extracellular repeat protein